MKKNQLKKMLAVMCTAVMAASALAGCGNTGGGSDANQAGNTSSQGNEADSEQSNNVSEKEPVTIQYFTWTSGSMAAIEPMVEKFNETNEDNITVEVVLKTGEWQTAL